MDRSRKRSGCSGNAQQQLGDDVPVEVLQKIQSRLSVKAAECLVQVMATRLVDHPYPQVTPWPSRHTDDVRGHGPHSDEVSVCLAEKWILLLATKTRVKELSIQISRSNRCRAREVLSFNLPYEILSSENLIKLEVNACLWSPDSARMTSSKHHHTVIIKCSSLRELHLSRLHISQKILDGILSSCSSSLEKVHLSECCSRDLNTINIKNLPCLHELSIDTINDGPAMSIDFVIGNVPNLRFFSLDVDDVRYERPSFNTHLISLASGSSSLTQLILDSLIMDTTSLDLIESGFPFLESLSLDMSNWRLGPFHFTCASIKSLSLFYCPITLVDLQIHAPKLCFFRFEGGALPTTFLFPISTTLNQVNLELQINMDAVDASFFLKMREALTLSPKCNLHIETYQFDQLP